MRWGVEIVYQRGYLLSFLLVVHLKDLGFKNPNIASREFIKAYEDLEEQAVKVGIKPKSGYSI